MLTQTTLKTLIQSSTSSSAIKATNIAKAILKLIEEERSKDKGVFTNTLNKYLSDLYTEQQKNNELKVKVEELKKEVERLRMERVK